MSEIIDRKLASELRKAILGIMPVYVTEGKVTTVDKVACTCDVEREDLPKLLGVRLNAIIEPGDVITFFPKNGSKVLCIMIGNQPTECYLLSTTEIDEVSIRISNTSILINNDIIEFNGGSLGGLVKAGELKAQIDKNSAILDAVLDILNGAPIAEPGNGQPSALQAALKTVLIGKETANLNDIEDDKVKH